MSMLAERKQRVKWSLNPRGNDWAKDENKFGQRMLEKMGWEPGTGLGAKGQGRTDFVRVQIKNDTKGFGNKEKYDEVWTKQQQNFDNLLAQLNGADKNNKNNDSINLSSLEDKSKKSRARVHYHKFTRGKDVSKYSSKDLNCIIGVGDKQSEDSSEQPTDNTNSMYNYFNKKMKMANKALYKDISNVEKSDSYTEMQEACNEVDESGNTVYIKNKTNNNSKWKTSENEENDNLSIFEDHFSEQDVIPVKKKNKIHKRRKRHTEDSENNDENERTLGENIQVELETQFLEKSNGDIDNKPLAKKKRKHKNVKKCEEND